MNQRIFAVPAMRVVSLPFSGPVVSALIRRKPPTPKTGTRAMARAMTPMPPSQWVWQRQRLTARGSDSTSLTTEAPVVVKPLMLSKTASVKLSKWPER